MYAPYMDKYAPFGDGPIEHDSDQYQNCDFTDQSYFESIPKRKLGTKLRIDETKTMFFKIGRVPVYSEGIFVFTGFENGTLMWTDIEDPEYRMVKDIKLSNPKEEWLDLNKLDFDQKYLMQAGWFVIINNKCGFLLNLESITEAYQGHLHKRWKVLLTQKFFLGIFKRFGQYIEEIYSQQKGESNGSLPREIPTTDFDPFLTEGFIPKELQDQLFLHQKQEVGWMFSLENYPAIKMRKKQNTLPFLDTGYYIDPNNLHEFLSEDNGNDFVDIMVPGGILASQIGSGKTVTMIALTNIGTQLMPREEGVKSEMYEESKINDMKVSTKKTAKNELSELLDGVYEPSLVIVTENILGQWADEFKKFAPNMKVVVIETEKDLADLHFDKGRLLDYEIILTHRKIIEQGHKIFAEHAPGIFQITFRRVIMDEIHELTNLMTEQARCGGFKKDKHPLNMLEFYRTLTKIDRRFTWGMTGTPDSLNYFYEADPLFKLLNLNQQWSQADTFKLKDEFVTTCMRKNPRSVDLPKLHKKVQEVFFGQLQNILYKGKLNYASDKKAAQEICSHILRQWRDISDGDKDYIQAGIEAIQAKYKAEIEELESQILKNPSNEKALQGRLNNLKSEGNFFSEVIKLISEEQFSCPICMVDQEVKQIVVTGCLHNLCVKCYEDLKKALPNPECPICREAIQNEGLIIHPKFSTGKNENKLTAILKTIEEAPKDEKVIIFTQFHSLVEHLSEIFTKKEIQYIVLRGSPSEINISLSNFKYNPEIKVLLMSVEQAASGINVQEANHVFFAHPIFGMSFEKAAITYNQCIGRAYRIGQKQEVDVRLFVTVESLEEDFVPSFNR